MAEVSPGDLVLSFMNGIVGYVGTATQSAFTAPRPAQFGAAGQGWELTGWEVPVEWERLPSPVRAKQRIAEFRSWVRTKYAPLSRETGNGNQGVYLTEIDEPLITFFLYEGQAGELLAGRPSSISAEQSGVDEAPLHSSETEQLRKARVGQALFRLRIRDRRCPLTDVANPALLVASHIKPWRFCLTAAERLDGENGLLLAPHVDRLFDKGLISFSDEGEVLISTRLSDEDVVALGLSTAVSRKLAPFRPEQRHYLDFHREHVFVSPARK